MTKTQEQEQCEACGGMFDTLAQVFSHECSGLSSGQEILGRERSPLANGPRATDKQVAFLIRLGVDADGAREMSKSTASETIDRLLKDRPPMPMSDKQEAFLRSLIEQKNPSMDADATVAALNELPNPSQGASAMIDVLKKAPNVTIETSVKSNRPGEGFWVINGSTIVKVQRAVHGSGNLYAKKLDDGGWFEYWQGGYNELCKAMDNGRAEPLTLERAKELGHLYGRCVICGRTLTDETSIANGIGPICAGRFA